MLLRTPDKLCAILEALVREIGPAFEVGISVKIRLLETPELTEALVRRLVATGIVGLTVHCRTPAMRPRERAIREQLRMVATMCREAGVACLMNGDVETRDQAVQLIDEYGVDGAMMAISAEKNPSCFRSEADGGLALGQEVSERYLRYAMDVGNRFGNTKFSLAHLLPGKSRGAQPVAQAKCYTAMCEALGLYHLLSQAVETDAILGISPDQKGKPKAKNNCVALAAGGKMAEARTAGHQPKKKLSERGVNSLPEPQKVTEAVLSM